LDVILGGGTDPFTAAGRTDKRDLIAEFQSLGYRYVTNANELRGVTFGQPTIGLFKGSPVPAPTSNGIAIVADVNMDVEYDKLKLTRPASEPTASLGTFTDQPNAGLNDPEGHRSSEQRIRVANVHPHGGGGVHRQAVPP
jgi:alkaline phosphatase